MIQVINESINDIKWFFAKHNVLVEGEDYQFFETEKGYEVIMSRFCFEDVWEYQDEETYNGIEGELEDKGYIIEDGINKYHYIIKK
jgi:hypothetical protein